LGFRSEVLGLRRDDVAFGERALYVRQRASRGELDAPKSATSRRRVGRVEGDTPVIVETVSGALPLGQQFGVTIGEPAAPGWVELIYKDANRETQARWREYDGERLIPHERGVQPPVPTSARTPT
jgi:hypothetical protein